ncbi:hypothetical protein SAMN05216564_11434 [Halopenitus persicus]|uniref:Uncharacterized protein n=1 Tax=Halopenitus persicus TaxID=1048396 RepID=A0A1H3NQC6_9EURY|nr:hypothetical protein SAMN05216564_11434 [Halopenitus persicus]
MQIERQRLMILLNALYDQDVESIPVNHPCEDIGELSQITLNQAKQTHHTCRHFLAYKRDDSAEPRRDLQLGGELLQRSDSCF